MTNHNRPITRLLLLLPPLAAAQSGRQSAPQYTFEYNASFNPALTVIVVVLVLAFFFLGFFSIYVRECVETSNPANPRLSTAVESHSRRTGKGVDSSVIETFPIFNYSEIKELKIGKGALECAVCLSEFEDCETLRLLPECSHVFHPECIDSWLASHSTCPVCRANLLAKETGVNSAQDGDSVGSSGEQSSRPERIGAQNEVSIDVEDDRTKESRVTTPEFPRSHSTGHSLVQSSERYTLRLPEEVRMRILTMKRSTSCGVVLGRQWSSTTGYRNTSDQDRVFGRSDRWVITMAPPFFTRSGSVWPSKVGEDGEVTVLRTSNKMFLSSIRTPFDCLARKSEGIEEKPNRPPV